MAVQLKNLSEQVLVITGASSGIGFTTAKMAAERGGTGSGWEHGNYPGHVMRSSAYTRASLHLHPGMLAVLALVGLWAALSMRQVY